MVISTIYFLVIIIRRCTTAVSRASIRYFRFHTYLDIYLVINEIPVLPTYKLKYTYVHNIKFLWNMK